MDRRIATRVIISADPTATLIQKDACEIWWIQVTPDHPGTQGEIRIYDGFDAGGKMVYASDIAYAHPTNFIPPIPCDQGIFVTTDDHLAGYTIGYRPKSWKKETP